MPPLDQSLGANFFACSSTFSRYIFGSLESRTYAPSCAGDLLLGVWSSSCAERGVTSGRAWRALRRWSCERSRETWGPRASGVHDAQPPTDRNVADDTHAAAKLGRAR